MEGRKYAVHARSILATEELVEKTQQLNVDDLRVRRQIHRLTGKLWRRNNPTGLTRANYRAGRANGSPALTGRSSGRPREHRPAIGAVRRRGAVWGEDQSGAPGKYPPALPGAGEVACVICTAPAWLDGPCTIHVGGDVAEVHVPNCV